jgi:hypothetical protein
MRCHVIRAVVFKQVAPTSDFTRTREIVLPGQHTAGEAWAAVHAAQRAPDGADYIGGEIRPA